MRYRILLSIFSLFIIITLTFFLTKVVPGDPFEQDAKLPIEVYQSLQRHYKLDQPWFIQYASYIKSVILWDFGPSMIYKDRTVNQIISEAFPVSATLGILSFTFTLFIGITFGSFMAYNRNKSSQFLQILLITLGTSIPSFILAVLLQYFFAYQLHWFPIARWGTFSHMILPALALSIVPGAFIARFMQNSIQQVLKQEYILTARAKGLSAWRIFWVHAFKNALLPLIAYMGQLIANILTGTVIVEKIFAIPGLGQWFVLSVNNRDYTAIMGITVFYSIILITSLFMCELLRRTLDPRERELRNKLQWG